MTTAEIFAKIEEVWAAFWNYIFAVLAHWEAKDAE